MAAGMAAGAAVSAVGSLMGAQATANSLNAQANLQIQNAQEAEAQGAFDANKSAIQSGDRIGQEVAGYAAAGVTSASGSATAVLMESASNAELDRLNILHGADIKAINYENQASMERAGASSAMVGGIFGALGAGSKAGASIYSMGAGATPSLSSTGTNGIMSAGGGDAIAGGGASPIESVV